MVAFADSSFLNYLNVKNTISGGRNKLNKLVVDIDMTHLEDNYNSLCKPNLDKEISPSVSADKGGFTNI